MLNPNYVVGLIDGEGSFTVFVRNPKKKNLKRRVKVEPRFYVKLVAKDRKLLYELKEFFGCGNVYFQRDKRENHQDCYRYEVANRRDLKDSIIPFFKKYPLKSESRKKDFKIFCRIIKLMEKGKHLTPEGLEEIFRIKQKMH